MAWRSRHPIARAAHELARLDRLTAQRHVVEGQVLATIVGQRGGRAVYVTTFRRDTAQAPWWQHEPDDYDGA